MSGLLGRLSFIGKRPINFRKAEVALNISSYKSDSDSVKFGKLPFIQRVRVSGKLGEYDVKLVDGLTCNVTEGLSSDESKLILGIDREKYGNFNKYQRAFLKSMHGTTNSLLMNYVEGISEVIIICSYGLFLISTNTLKQYFILLYCIIVYSFLLLMCA